MRPLYRRVAGQSALLGIVFTERTGKLAVNHYLFVEQLLVVFFRSSKLERVCQSSFALLHAGNDVGATEPVRFRQIGF